MTTRSGLAVLLGGVLLSLTGFVDVAAADDPLTKARLAAIEGRHGECVDLAKEARQQNPKLWQANQVYASCTALDAQKRKAELGPKGYEAKVMDAIEVMEGIIQDDTTMTSRQRLQFSYMAIEMRKQLQLDLAEMRDGAE